MDEPDHQGHCTICGTVGLFQRGEQRSLRESYACPGCRFTLRWRDQAAVVIDEFGRGQALSIDQMVSRGLLRDVTIYEPALRGPFVARFQGLPNYTRSYFRPDEPLGLTFSDGVRNEDLTRLSFDEDSFDLIITSDVMEHLPDIERAFAETLRVLRPGGVHVFTIPNDFPFPERTEARVRIENGEEIHVKPARYHNSGDGSKCLVYTDYGTDISDMIRALGGQLAVVRRSIDHAPSYTNATFVMRKIAPAGARRPGQPIAADAAPKAPAYSMASSEVPAEAQPPALECPICHGTEFEAFNGRQNARCVSCRGVERNRLMWMVLEKLGVFQPDHRVLHLAPELGLARKFVDLSGDAYQGADLDADRYNSKFINVRKLDLCTDLAEVPDDSFDLILHSHVLEHIPCDVTGVLREMDRILVPGGLHFLSVPVRGEHTAEDLSPDLTDAERLARFGQEDHMRIFGSVDLQEMLAEVWGAGDHLIEPIRLFARDDLRRAAIPTVAWQGVSGHSIFHYRKGARPPAEALSKPKEVKTAPMVVRPARQSVARAGAAGASASGRAQRNQDTNSYPQEGAPKDSDIIEGLDALRRDDPWPDFPRDAHAPFELALDCNGDGGLWPDETGKFVMQDAIKEFANEHGFEIEAKRQSWVLHR